MSKICILAYHPNRYDTWVPCFEVSLSENIQKWQCIGNNNGAETEPCGSAQLGTSLYVTTSFSFPIWRQSFRYDLTHSSAILWAMHLSFPILKENCCWPIWICLCAGYRGSNSTVLLICSTNWLAITLSISLEAYSRFKMDLNWALTPQFSFWHLK